MTGPSGVRRTCDLGEQRARDEKHRDGAKGRRTLLMIRHVSRDSSAIVRRLVREIRDEERAQPEYDTGLAVIAFVRDQADGAADGQDP